MADEPDPTERRQLTISERDLQSLADDLSRWLAGKVAADEPPRVHELTLPQGSGMSSASVLFDAEWSVGGRAEGGSFVARLAPTAADFPVFETYDLAKQYHVMAGVAAATDVPVPPLCWLETDESVLGTPFFVMRRIDGRVPADNPPYVFYGWLFDAEPAERALLTDNTLAVLAKIHAIPDPAARFPMLDGPGQALRRHVDWHRAWYRWALADDGYPIPLLERAFDWLDAHWPADPGPDVLSWGDSRPGNIIYDGFEPVAVLDWEMAGLGPRELDVAWIVFIHRFFQDLATRFEQPGLPDFLRRSEVVAKYEELTGYTVRDLDFYLVYAALRHGIVMARVKRRMIHFGEDTDTPDRDDYVMHRASLEALLDGTYEWT
ncbi:Predicted kinase, aminoglycoside phosphotransferase (APT) family [Nocardia amikacinitolerans]|uniref:Predicted kinase, aminoglycoside phosphotransferase (APT) family n=1 Tax=Nocardia amikacinitolerans TaxID=756689 RepID=A0A285LUR7_9NOCA|nr:phosphotransferase family protein [Nocardia amikacinitolerans]MCP2280183.1 putative kinase, aminoglycoside phosphotransferase (APT) family [Nocardia amikacinitolerans]MCP2299454.1 putative kinase, aminoglycoside phosphotransferase (APT) family [Nocardia amikacinitolerans]SNY88669.1 Predicted kinase, aminoglycoside phosphotransferase (APT) family [Nocardia amikacinitolerans]